jgi:trigger factor
MDIKIDKQKTQVKLNIELTQEEFAKFIDLAISDLGKDLEIKGFRKGKAPKDIIEQAVGREKILVEAGNFAVQNSYRKAVEQNNLEAIDQPEIKISKIGYEGPMVFEASFPIISEFELADYKKIAGTIKREKVEVGEKDIEGALKWIQRSRAKLSAKTGIAEKGDFVEIEYWSPDVHEIGLEHKKKDAFILGEGHFFNGFEDIIPGMKSGEEKKEIELEIPKDHSFKKVAGKKIKFNILLISIQKVEYPELNDEFAKSLGKFENLTGLKKNIVDGMTREKEYEVSKKARNEAVEKISEATKIEIPQALINREAQRMLEDFKHDVAHRINTSFEEYLKSMGKTEEDLKKMIIPEAEKKVKSYLVLREIGRKENVSASNKEVDEEVKKNLEKHPGVDLEDLKEYAKEVIKTEKVFQIIENLIK